MNTLKLSPFSSTPSLPLTAVFSAVLLLSACSSSDSGSDDSLVADTQPQVSDIEALPESGVSNANDEQGATADAQNAVNASDDAENSINASDNQQAMEPMNASNDSSVPNNTSGASAPTNNPSASTPANDLIQVVPDPMAPQSTRITFDITVPAYSSNELLVNLVWGDIQTSAAWVADELWTLSEDFPIDTENDLLVTFFDRNGDVTLASYESTLRTGFNSVDSIQILADQFDSNRWDTDGDGVSNLEESILGGDSVQLELLETYNSRPRYINRFHTDIFETQVPDERPYFEFLEVESTISAFSGGPAGEDRTLTIDIDDSGTGTLTEDYTSYRNPGSTVSGGTDATRTNTGNSIIWDGLKTRLDHNSGVIFEDDLSVETKRVDTNTLSAEGTFLDWVINTGPSTILATEFALTGEPVADSTHCESTAGEVTQVFRSGGQVDEITTVSKGANDQFWTVVETTFGFGDLQTNDLDSVFDLPTDTGTARTYLTRTLGITFYCDYPELR